MTNVVKEKPEAIRAWYSRTTHKARKVLMWLSFIGSTAAIVTFAFVPAHVTERIQQFNGALTIPLFGLIWILGFIYLFLIPQREAAFRGQEWIEAMVTTFQTSMADKVGPAVKTWTEIGEKVKTELPAILGEVRGALKKASDTMDDLRTSAKNLAAAVERNEKIVEDVKPAIEALKRIESRFESEIKNGFFEKLDVALESVRGISGVPQGEEQPPDVGWVLDSIRRNKAKAAGSKA